jgi:hypothetical protein
MCVVRAWSVLTRHFLSSDVQNAHRTQADLTEQVHASHLQRTVCALTSAVYKSWADGWVPSFVFKMPPKKATRKEAKNRSERPLQAFIAAAELTIYAVVGAAFQGSGSCDFLGASIGRLYIYHPTVAEINSRSPHLHALVRTPYVSSACKYWQSHGDLTL